MIVPRRHFASMPLRYYLRGVGLHQDYESCGPLDLQCINRNAQRQAEDTAERAETNRLSFLATCERNCELNPALPCYCAQYGGSDRPGTVAVPAGPSSPGYQPVPSAAPPQYSYSVTISNQTHPGQGFQVGDRYRLEVHGAPNKIVSASATQNGRSTGTASFGTTNAQGVFALENTFGAEAAGQWVEAWTVGDIAAGSLSFQVSAAPQAPASTSTTGASASTGGGQTAGSQTAGGGSQSTAPPPAPAAIPWGWIAAAGVGVVVLMGMGGRH